MGELLDSSFEDLDVLGQLTVNDEGKSFKSVRYAILSACYYTLPPFH
jgi:hypothetical protein